MYDVPCVCVMAFLRDDLDRHFIFVLHHWPRGPTFSASTELKIGIMLGNIWMPCEDGVGFAALFLAYWWAKGFVVPSRMFFGHPSESFLLYQAVYPIGSRLGRTGGLKTCSSETINLQPDYDSVLCTVPDFMKNPRRVVGDSLAWNLTHAWTSDRTALMTTMLFRLSICTVCHTWYRI